MPRGMGGRELAVSRLLPAIRARGEQVSHLHFHPEELRFAPAQRVRAERAHEQEIRESGK